MTYIVQPGDTLFGIASRFGTSVQAIMQANQLTSPILYVGQVLFIPGVQPPGPGPGPGPGPFPPFPPFPPTPTPPGNVNERLNRLEREVNNLDRRVTRIERQLNIRSEENS